MGAIADRAQETTNTTGAGTLTLVGAVAGYQSFTSAFPTKRGVEYVIKSGTDWEDTYGVFDPAGPSLTREIVRRSSNAGAAINVAAGAFVWSDIGADNFTSSVQKFRNRIINSSWRFDQLNEGTVYTFSGSGGQGPDGWSGNATGAGAFTMQRVADPDNASLFALKVACTVADVSIGATDNYAMFAAIEGFDVADLKIGTANAPSVTLSFDMKFDVTGVYGIWLQNAAGSRFYVGTATQNVASTNESKTLTAPLDVTGTWLYTNGVGLYFGIQLAGGSNFQGVAGAWTGIGTPHTTAAQCNFMSANTNTGYIKRIQLEKGTVATPFEEISVADDFRRVQRYAEKDYDQGIACGTAGTGLGVRYYPFTTAIGAASGINLKVVKRAAPAFNVWRAGPTPTAGQWDSVALGALTPTLGSPTTTGCEFISGGGATDVFFGHWYANARLA